MTLSVGTQFGSYEIRDTLGAGGMGEVYRARDSNLNRDIALKVLPEQFATDPDRLARFQREAQLLASLNHPSIASIYGFVESNGVRALVLELVEGATLADRIGQGPMPLGEALPIARQLTDALEAAHAQGIIHRDLKPANIKLRPDGAIKVLDFGLAKVLEPASTSASVSQSPTITTPAMTQMGAILGTAAYMSPEQAKGRAADKRSDIWAFGCVLFEMLTGQRAFRGEDVADVLAFILTKEPAWSLLPPATPPSIRRLLRRCLEKDRGRRLADIADARLELDECSAPGAATDSAPPARGSVRRALLWALGGAVLSTALWLAGTTLVDRRSRDTRVIRSSLLLPGRLGGRTGRTIGANIALSPDGRRVVVVAIDSTGHACLWLRDMDGTAARPIADTENGFSPFWSPDGRWLAFVADGKLKKINPSGGSAITLCESAYSGGAWSRDDVILFTQSTTQTLAKVSAAGGTPSSVTALDAKANEIRHHYPSFLADGRHFVYRATGVGDAHATWVASLDSHERVALAEECAYAQCARGFLFFTRGSTLMAQRFDERRRALVEDALVVAEQLRMDTEGARYFSVSPSGALVYQQDPSPGLELTWYDRTGRRTGTLGTRADYSDISISPDGKRVVVSVGGSGTTNRDLWIFDVTRGIRSRFTTGPAPETHNTWSPDGQRIAFDSWRGEHRDMYVKDANGVGDEEPLLRDRFDSNPVAWSPDGRFILYIRRSPGLDAWVLPLDGGRRPVPFLNTPSNELPTAFSPDGRWVAYMSDETGRWEIYVSPFPGPGSKTQISTAGGYNARWTRDGREILYQSLDRNLMTAAVSTSGGRFDVGQVTPLFLMPPLGDRFNYDVSPDGRRILAATRLAESAGAPLTLVVNWPGLLKE